PEDKPSHIPPPTTLGEAKKTPWWPQYRKAAEEEIKGLEDNGTWSLVPISSVPRGKNILRGKFVFDDKRDDTGKIVRFKARFVAMGFTQRYGEDYFETYASVVATKSLRTMLSILNEDPTHTMEHWDVKLAFTQARVEEELYMFQPEGFEKVVENGSVSGPGPTPKPQKFVCRLHKSLYGLKQSACNWQLLLVACMRDQNFLPLFLITLSLFLERIQPGVLWGHTL